MHGYRNVRIKRTEWCVQLLTPSDVLVVEYGDVLSYFSTSIMPWGSVVVKALRY